MSVNPYRVSKAPRRDSRHTSRNAFPRTSNVLRSMTVEESTEEIDRDSCPQHIIYSHDVFDHFFPENDNVRRVIPELEKGDMAPLKNGRWRLQPYGPEKEYILPWFLTVMKSVNEALDGLGIARVQLHFRYEPNKSMEDGSRPDCLLYSLKTYGIKHCHTQRHGNNAYSSPFWGQVLIPIEPSQGFGWVTKGRDKVCDRARRIFHAQSSRYHCFGLALTNRWATLYYIDRRGVVQSNFFNFEKDPITFIRLLVGFATLSDEKMGFSPDYTREDNTAVSMAFDGVQLGGKQIMNLEVLRPSSGLAGRCTTLFRGEIDGKAVVVKESFPHPNRTHEGRILAKVHSCNGGHAVGVPTCIDFEKDSDVLLNIGVITEAIKEGTWVPRVRRRIVLREHLKDVRLGSTPECLLIAIDGVLSGILACVRANIVHCDITQGNVMLQQDEEAGMLIDFDVAYDTTAEEAKTHRSGTPAFMSVRMLENSSSSNTHNDDIESIFWTMVWIAFTSNGPSKDVHRSPIADWHTLSMQDLAMVKVDFLADLEDNLCEMALFYAPLKEVLLEIKDIVFDEEKTTVEGTIEKLKRVIREARENLVDGGRQYNGLRWVGRGVVRLPQEDETSSKPDSEALSDEDGAVIN